ncbi:ATP-binding cassette domain-containing protein [Nocardioides acrostichi]|uniref:ATP-binding cassette domain-containing protein n=1 Tax=Nocardioides acrostichi TaxID=2784339 RepID=A0A930YBX3_9ACTN|nr:ATP-binding cassette domain-containing protein [Nocardioides acrostichi]MBF4162923.1 ATP-binding cassette domain-containing protein [Nocardioides acrostichi]
MAAAPPFVIEGLGKSFGSVRAVHDLSFRVEPGRVTGFLGPNGSGKTTTLRMLLGLVRPTEGRALVGDRPYAEHPVPGALVGAALEATGFHPGRTGLGHLEVYAAQVGADRARAREVLGMVGMSEAAGRKVGGYSLGMRQRLGLATALLADPPALVLDEPVNGLDPEGIVWLRQFLRHLAEQGRTVLVSSHVLGEVQHTVDDVVIIKAGQLVHASSLSGLAELADQVTRVVAPDAEAFARLAADRGWSTHPVAGRGGTPGVGADVVGASAAEVGAACFAVGLELHQLATRGTDLEDVFFRLTGHAADPTVGEGAA